LAYISPLRRTYLFVDRRGGKVAECSLERLARELRAGRASVIETTSLFDQAMGDLLAARRAGAGLH
jgi:hypothetical protein